MRLSSYLFRGAGLAMWLALALVSYSWNWRQVFADGQTYFVDPDCYARMTRAQQVIAAPWKPVKFHDFENAPSGTTPHTTAPMDLLLAALGGAFHLGHWMARVPSPPLPLDLAGAFVSPLLGLALVTFLWWWGSKIALPYRNAMLLVVSVSPILVHGFQLGRPDHQSLVVLLVGAALATEISLWRQPSRSSELFSAVLWALALWTSLFEPLVLLGATALMRLAVLGRDAIPSRNAVLVFAVLLLSAILFDGWRIRAPSAEEQTYFFRWALNIGELRHATLPQLFRWTGWLLIASPPLLLWRSWKHGDRACAALAVLLLLLTGLSLWHVRWGYFLAIGFALTLPSALTVIPSKPVAWLVFAISLGPMAAEWDRQLYPDEEGRVARAENREDAFLLRETAQALLSPHRTIVLAPWWLSPAIAYWSGQRCVSGSSHQSLPGTVDTARFYLSKTSEEAREILRKRSVKYVIAYEPSRVISNSAQVLGRLPPERPLGETLYHDPLGAPPFLRLVYENKFFKVFEFVDN
ncbi:MAG TPA: hypothetical protein VFO90_05095 [Terrimicrobiaceae bacterium]|nr:hypothetical protein [Terrimicrobiaceae bacterium]